MTQLLFVNAKQVATCAGPGRARHGAEMSDATVLTDTAVAVDGENIIAVGLCSQLLRDYPDAEQIDCAGGVLTPGLVDSHTHAIFGRARYEEQEMRAAGVGYMDIARRGGGIHSSVADLRARSEDDLFALALPRIARLASYGSTTIEVKSGYGLSLEDELKSLRVIERLSREVPVRLVPTWLGAHEIPREFRERDAQRRDYLRHLIDDMLPQVAAKKLASFADVFCEPGVFTVAETREILTASRAAGLALKLHADELEPHGGAELAAELGATSADHLGAISDAGIAALARSDTVATLLPGTMLFLGKEKQRAGSPPDRRGSRRCAGHRFQPRNVSDIQFSSHSHTRCQPASHERCRGNHRRHSERGSGAWARRAALASLRPDIQPIWPSGRQKTFVRYRIGMVIVVVWRRGREENLVTLSSLPIT